MYAHTHTLHTMPRHTASLLAEGMQVLMVYAETLCSLHHVHIQGTAYSLYLFIMQPAIAGSHKVCCVQERQPLPSI